MRGARWAVILAVAAFVFFVALIIATIPKAHAAPPVGSDASSSVSKWYRSLRQPVTGISCCSEADCRATPARQRPDGSWQAMLGSEWIDIPPNLIIEDEQHPGGQAVLCSSGATLFCFTRPGSAG